MQKEAKDKDKWANKCEQKQKDEQQKQRSKSGIPLTTDAHEIRGEHDIMREGQDDNMYEQDIDIDIDIDTNEDKEDTDDDDNDDSEFDFEETLKTFDTLEAEIAYLRSQNEKLKHKVTKQKRMICLCVFSVMCYVYEFLFM